MGRGRRELGKEPKVKNMKNPKRMSAEAVEKEKSNYSNRDCYISINCVVYYSNDCK